MKNLSSSPSSALVLVWLVLISVQPGAPVPGNAGAADEARHVCVLDGSAAEPETEDPSHPSPDMAPLQRGAVVHASRRRPTNFEQHRGVERPILLLLVAPKLPPPA